MKIKSSNQIIAITTDPYNNIYGYSLIFFRLFDYLQKNSNEVEIKLFSNNGVSSQMVKNKNFQTIVLNPRANLVFKTLYLTFAFIFKVFRYPKSTVIISNGELPEVMASLVLRIKFPMVYCIFQDDRVRDASLFARGVCRLRLFLLHRHKNIIFTNTFTMNRFVGNVNKYYIGNPVFLFN